MSNIHKFNDATSRIIGIAIVVRKNFGPGYEETFYQRALALELISSNLRFTREQWVPIYYKNKKIGTKRVDFIIENIIVEIKAKSQFDPQDYVQTLSYLKASKFKTALLLNFGSPKIQIKRFVN
jgi:GxxExxY protein